uniref:Putative secreted protein n=1 Tax=Rhipicephalus microplus TaxID=6941 RepID=A0A6M2DAZ5_RHIMP
MKAQLLVLVAVFAVAPMAFQAQDLSEDDLKSDLLHGHWAPYDQFYAPEVEGREQSFPAQDPGEEDLEHQGVQARFVNGQ